MSSVLYISKNINRKKRSVFADTAFKMTLQTCKSARQKCYINSFKRTDQKRLKSTTKTGFREAQFHLNKRGQMNHKKIKF